VASRSGRSPEAGINRVWWDLRHEAPKQAKLRTVPPGNPHVWEEDRFKEYKGKGYPIVSWGIGGGQIGPLAVPGTFSVRLSVDERESTQALVVRKDPTTAGTEGDIRAQVKVSLELRDTINLVVESIDRIEWMRKQLDDLGALLEGNGSAGAIRTAAAALNTKLVAVEEQLFSQVLAEGDSKSFRAPIRLYSELAVLAGDVMSADFAPTAAMLEVQQELENGVATARAALDALIAKEVAAFNTMLRTSNIQPIHVQE